MYLKKHIWSNKLSVAAVLPQDQNTKGVSV